MFDLNDLRKSTAGWKLSAAQKQRIESHCLHAEKPAPAILLWMKRCAKPALAVAVAAATLFAMLLIWPLFRQPNTNETITAGAPEARPDTPYENPEDSGGRTDFEKADDQTQPTEPKEPEIPEDPIQTEPPEQTPPPVVPAEWKDPAVTDAQRAALFELTQKYRIDALYDFDEEHPIDLEAFKYYCWYHLTEQEITLVEGGCTYPGDRLEWFAMNWFGTDYGLDFGEEIFLKAGSMRSLPLTEVIRYTEEQEGDQLKITARCIVYHYNDYEYLDKEDILNHEAYAARKKAILKGRAADYSSYSVFDVTFLLNASSIDHYKDFYRLISFTSYGGTDGTTELSIPAWPYPAATTNTQPGMLNIDSSITAYVTSIEEEGQFARAYTFQNEDSRALLKLLDETPFIYSNCYCIHPISIHLDDGTSFGFWTEQNSFLVTHAINHAGNGVTFSSEDAATIEKLLTRNLIEKNRKPELDLFRPH